MSLTQAGLGALTANFRFSTFAAMGKLCLESAAILNSGLYCVLANFSIFVLRFKFTFYETLDSLKFSLRHNNQRALRRVCIY